MFIKRKSRTDLLNQELKRKKQEQPIFTATYLKSEHQKQYRLE